MGINGSFPHLFLDSKAHNWHLIPRSYEKRKGAIWNLTCEPTWKSETQAFDDVSINNKKLVNFRQEKPLAASSKNLVCLKGKSKHVSSSMLTLQTHICWHKKILVIVCLLCAFQDLLACLAKVLWLKNRVKKLCSSKKSNCVEIEGYAQRKMLSDSDIKKTKRKIVT